MENIAEITEYQKEINRLMEKYEEYSRELLVCEVDDITSYIEKRQNISEKVTALSNSINAWCAADETGMCMAAFRNSCGRSEVPDELKQVFDLRQEFNGIAFRIKNLDVAIVERIEIEKDMLIKKIKDNNSGQNAKASKYMSGIVDVGKDVYFPKREKKI